MAYEFGMMVQTLEIKPGLADANSNEVSQALSQGLLPLAQQLPKAIETLPPGGWEVVSHDLTRIDRHLIVSFLIRRSL